MTNLIFVVIISRIPAGFHGANIHVCLTCKGSHPHDSIPPGFVEAPLQAPGIRLMTIEEVKNITWTAL